MLANVGCWLQKAVSTKGWQCQCSGEVREAEGAAHPEQQSTGDGKMGVISDNVKNRADKGASGGRDFGGGKIAVRPGHQ